MAEKATRAELIAELVTDKFSGFKEGDETFLELPAVTDERLLEFKAAAETNKNAAAALAKSENDGRNTSARLKVAEEKLKVAEQKPTKEQWLEAAPAELKTLLDRQATAEAELRADLIGKLKTLGANTEDELKAMDIPQLQTLAKYAKVDAPQVDFSGRGAPRSPNAPADNNDYAPPNPYEADLKVLQGQTKAVN